MTEIQRAFVLLSGGIDSTTALHIAAKDFGEVEGVSIDYEQRHRKELTYARMQCERLGIKHTTLFLEALPGTMLTRAEEKIPDVHYSDIEGVSPTYVPFRNGTMLSLITAHAQGWVGQDDEKSAAIFFGAHAEDAHNWAYPDCTPEFIGAMANAIHVGTYFAIRLHTPLMWLRKHEIVRLGHELGVDFSVTWSCYAGGDKHCGACPTCHARREAFELAGIEDPTEYATANEEKK